jgi:hypothetical protein
MQVSPESVTALEFWGDSQLQLLAVGDKQVCMRLCGSLCGMHAPMR